jgi:hypothetical protein
VSNARVVARGIADYDGDETIKTCLQTLFNWELQNATLKNPPFKATYVRAIEQAAVQWQGPAGGADE